MPIVKIEMWTGRTHAQKAELAKAITDAMVSITNTTPEATIIVLPSVDTNKVLLLDREGAVDELPLMSKYDVGHEILDRVLKALG